MRNKSAPTTEEPQSEISDSAEAAVAAAAASAASAALDAANKSGAVVDRLLEEDFNAKVNAVRKSYQGHRCQDEEILGDVRYSVDRVCLEPRNDDSDDESMALIAPSMANTKLSFKRHRHRSQIPQDYMDLQRHFAAQHPYQHRPLSIERVDGSLVPPSEKHFEDGETIVFREFAIGGFNSTNQKKLTRGHLKFTKSGRRTLPLVEREPRPFDWERGYAEWAREYH